MARRVRAPNLPSVTPFAVSPGCRSGLFPGGRQKVSRMNALNSQVMRYGVRVAGVLAAVVTGLFGSWYAGAAGWPIDGSAHNEPALMALGVALVVGLRAVARVDRSLG